MSDTTCMTLTEPHPSLFDEENPKEPAMDDATRAQLIADAAGDRGLQAAEEATARRADGVQADLGGQLDNDPSWKISEETKAIGRRGIAEARDVLKSIPRRPDSSKN